MKKLLALFLVAALAGCSTTDQYRMYADSHAKMETAKYIADAAKYKAMSDIASAGSETAKVAAVMAIALGQAGGVNQNAGLQAPQRSEALQWAQILVPSVIQGVGIIANRQIAITNSNTAASVARSTNDAFVSMAGKIQAPAANVTTTATDDHTQTLSGTGTLGSGTYDTIDNHAVSTTTATDDNSVTTNTDDNSTSTPVFATPVFSPVPVKPVP